MHPRTARALFAVLAVKAVVLVGLLAFLQWGPDTFHDPWWTEVHVGNYGVPPDGPPTLRTKLSTFDAQHYLNIAERGYRAGDPSLAHYPLWPMLVRLGAPLCGGDYLLSGLLLANLLSLLALVLLYDWIRRTRGADIADVSLALMLAFPGSLFLMFAYSEALFLLLGVLVFVLLERGRPGLAACVAGLLPMTRAVGLGVILVLLVHRGWRSHLHRLASVVPALFGFGLYLGIIQLATGDPWAGFRIQAGYIADSSILDVLDPIAFAQTFLQWPLKPHGYLDSAVDRVVFVGFVAAAWLVVRRWRDRPEEAAYTVPLGLVPAATVKMMAFTRYAAVLFPAFVAVAEALAPRRHRPWVWGLVATFAAVQAWFSVRHISHMWVG